MIFFPLNVLKVLHCMDGSSGLQETIEEYF